MRSGRPGMSNPDILYGVDASKVKREGALVYPLDQYYEISQTKFPDGLCFGLTASLMLRLRAGDYRAISSYKNPLLPTIIEEAEELTMKAIDMEREGIDSDRIPFKGHRPKKAATTLGELSPFLGGRTKSAMLTYSMSDGNKHRLLFFKKPNGECVIQDPNRCTVDKLVLKSAKSLLRDIMSRSNPDKVVIAYDQQRSASL